MTVNKLEFLYRLNLPSLDAVLHRKDVLGTFTEKLSNGSRIFYPDPNEIFKKEWLEYKGLHWDYVSIFVRSATTTGMIHRDNPDNNDQLHWGINWIVGDNGCMDYWLPGQINQEKIVTDIGGGQTVSLVTDEQPYRQYDTYTGVYLINASVPHRARNLSDKKRIAISLHSKKFRYQNPRATWQKIIDLFQIEIDQCSAT